MPKICSVLLQVLLSPYYRYLFMEFIAHYSPNGLLVDNHRVLMERSLPKASEFMTGEILAVVAGCCSPTSHWIGLIHT